MNSFNKDNYPQIKQIIKDFLKNGLAKRDILQALEKRKIKFSHSDYERCLRYAIDEMRELVKDNKSI